MHSFFIEDAVILRGVGLMTIQKVFVGSRKEVVVVCPQCDRSVTVPVDRIRNMGKPVRARCACGIQFSVVFERRANYRKSTEFLGSFVREPEADPQIGEMVVANLSRSGLCMKVPESVRLEIGEVLSIDFRLDNQEQTLIRAQVVVKNIREGIAGAEFHSLGEHTRKLLGFYLMP
jgi:hypothetical protein